MKKLLYVFLLLISIIGLVSCSKGSTLHTDLQEKFFTTDYTKVTDYVNGTEELSRPLPYHLEFKGVKSADNYCVELTEKGTANKIVYYTTESKGLDVYNLKSNTTYTWTVNESEQKEFTTPSGMRNLYIDGLTNARDIGGYSLGDGAYVKQGMLIRTSRLNENYTGEQLITEKGVEELKRLGIKTELDLRKVDDTEKGKEQAGITVSACDGVNYISFPMQSGGNYLQLNRTVLKDLFKILADENNYPILFHCSIGTDRTGVVAFLVNGLLGVSKDDLYRDYLFSNFGNIGGMRFPSTIDDYIKRVTSDESKSLKENIYSYLIRQGVEKADLDSVIEIMTK